ncbi:MAG: PadR family transcriptional regulator [Oscillospiraceae bacterium]|jgi:PadR family transcriptional regulator PadR|nr:PadR family transcriptional regulator [Oscillospiraceae bacterium]
MDAQMKKGVLELCLLQCLSGEPKYGYDVIQTMRAYFPEVTESTFYAVLRRLHKEGAAETFQGGASNGPVRKYYRLTDQGREQLEQLAEDWRRLREITEALGIGR